MTTPATTTDRPHPLVKAAAIDAALAKRTHFLNRDATLHQVSMSDMAGMGNALGVNKNVLPPNGESTEMHHHVNESEWMYILAGSGNLLLTPVVMDGLRTQDAHPQQVEEIPCAAGDFIGFPAGAAAEAEGLYAHSFRAGNEGCTYLVGGTREAMDVCVYPLRGKTLINYKRRVAAATMDSADLDVVPPR